MSDVFRSSYSPPSSVQSPTVGAMSRSSGPAAPAATVNGDTPYLAWWNHKGVRFKSGRPVKMLLNPSKRPRHEIRAEAYAIGLAIGKARKLQRERMKAA